MSNNINRYDWKFDSSCRGIKDKEKLFTQYIRYMFARTQKIFEYSNLPNTIPKRDLELLLQHNGFGVFAKDNKGDLYVFNAGLGGIPNAYYLPSTAIINNPYLSFNKTLEIDKDCIVVTNDSMYLGLNPMFEKYASLLSETDLTIRLLSIVTRSPYTFMASTDSEKESIEEMISSLENGEIKVIVTKLFEGLYDGTKTLEFGNIRQGCIKELIELQQYLKSSWYIDLGLNAPFNGMKRESINESESSMNDDVLLPFIDDMLECRKEGIKKVNEMFGTNIEVDLSSSWKEIREDIIRQDKLLESEIVNNESEEIKEDEVKDESGVIEDET